MKDNMFEDLKIKDNANTRWFQERLSSVRGSIMNFYVAFQSDIQLKMNKKASYNLLSKEEQTDFRDQLVVLFTYMLIVDLNGKGLYMYFDKVSKDQKKLNALIKDFADIMTELGYQVGSGKGNKLAISINLDEPPYVKEENK